MADDGFVPDDGFVADAESAKAAPPTGPVTFGDVAHQAWTDVKKAASNIATIPQRAFGAVNQYETEGTYNPAPMMEAASLGTPSAPRVGLPAPILAPKPTGPTVQDLQSVASSAYRAPEVAALKLKPQALTDIGSGISSHLANEGYDPLLAPKTFGLLEKSAKPPDEEGAFATAQNIQTLRRMLGKAAESPDKTERSAAQIAQRRLDDMMAKIPPQHVLEGDAQAASNILGQARGNYAAASRSERLSEALARAEKQAQRAGVGGNLENATRQRITEILNSPNKRRGFSKDEISALDDYVAGNFTRNSLRVATKVLGGDNPLMAVIHTGLAWSTSGLSLAAPLTGYALKRINNAISARQLDRIDEMIRTRSPAGKEFEKAISDWSRAAGSMATSPTAVSANKFLSAAKMLGNRFMANGIPTDVRQLAIPFQAAGTAGAEESEQNIPRPPGQQKDGGAAQQEQRFAHGGRVAEKDKETHAVIQYQANSKHHGKHCSACDMFVAGKIPGCTAVKRPIWPKGWCRLFQPKRFADGGGLTGWVEDGDKTPFEIAADRTRQSVMPGGGRREGLATTLPEHMVMDFLKTPQRAFGAVNQYETEGTYDPAPIMNAAMMAAGPGASGAQSGAAGIFGGRLAKTADQVALARAEQMATKGASREQVWNETGWFVGADGKWRFEIPDENLFVRKGYGAGLEHGAGEAWNRTAPKIEHPQLTEAYPGKFDYLAHDVTIARGQEPSGRFMPEGPGRNEEYSYSDRPVLPSLFVEAPTTRQARSIASHELQHAVQGQEGFAKGASPQSYSDSLWGETHDRQELAKRAYDLYRRTAGEVEARNVQARLRMTPEERRARPPWLTEDVPLDRQVVRSEKP